MVDPTLEEIAQRAKAIKDANNAKKAAFEYSDAIVDDRPKRKFGAYCMRCRVRVEMPCLKCQRELGMTENVEPWSNRNA